MDKCPKCGQWTLSLDVRRGKLICRRISCGYEENVDVDNYLQKNNVLPKLVETLKMNEKIRTL